MTTTLLEKPSIEEIKKTSKVRKLLTQLPIIAGCDNSMSLSLRFGEIFDLELKGDTAFNCLHEDIENPGNRLAIVNPARYNPKYYDRADIGFSRLVIAEFSTYLSQGKITKEKMQEVINEYGKDAQEYNAEINAILTYEEAITLSYWW
jgi:hypothetical protein